MLHGDAAGLEAGGGVGGELLGEGVVPAEVGERGHMEGLLSTTDQGREPPRPSREARLLCQPTGRAGRGQEEAVSAMTATSFVGDTDQYAYAARRS